MEKEKILEYHRKGKGKIGIVSKVPLTNQGDLAQAYTPGVAEVCREIQQHPEKVFEYTSKGNSVAVVTDGSAILGMGGLSPLASIPLAEGKCVLFKELAGIDAFPICLDTRDVDEIVETVKRIAPVFGGINLEDISAPRCFEVERRLINELNIPVFHDDQHGTAVVVLAGLMNALKVVGKKLEESSAAICGAGAAGIAVGKFLLNSGLKDLTLCDSKGIVSSERDDLNPYKKEMAELTGKKNGTLQDAMKGRDIFIGVSKAGLVSKEMVRSMSEKAIVFAMANPDPEIMPEDAKAAGAAVVATGRSDLPNQVNNALGFPGIFRGALDARAKRITEEMKVAAADALAGLISEPTAEKIIAGPLDKRVVPAVAGAVKKAAIGN